jgi:hypothetical protein
MAVRWQDDGVAWTLAAVGLAVVGSVVADRVGSRAKMSESERAALPASAFAIPESRDFPIPNLEYGKRALTYAMWPNNAENRSRVKEAVFARYPSLIGWWNATSWVGEHPEERYMAAPKRATVDVNAILASVV